MRAGRDSFPFKQSAMSVQSKQGLIAGVCALSFLNHREFPPKYYSEGQRAGHVWLLRGTKEALFCFRSTSFCESVDTVSQHA